MLVQLGQGCPIVFTGQVGEWEGATHSEHCGERSSQGGTHGRHPLQAGPWRVKPWREGWAPGSWSAAGSAWESWCPEKEAVRALVRCGGRLRGRLPVPLLREGVAELC